MESNLEIRLANIESRLRNAETRIDLCLESMPGALEVMISSQNEYIRQINDAYKIDMTKILYMGMEKAVKEYLNGKK